MKNKPKFALILSGIYLTAAIISFLLPRIFSFGGRLGTITTMPMLASGYAIIVFFISLIGNAITPFLFPPNLLQYCKPDQFFIICNGPVGIFVSILVNTAIYFILGYFIGSFLKENNGTQIKFPLWAIALISMAAIVIFFVLIFKILFI